MSQVVLAVLVGVLAGAVGGAVVPRLVAWCPDPAPDPDEDPEDFPDHVPFVELARRPGLGARCALAGGLSGGALGAALGDLTGGGWALAWFLVLLPFATALAVIDLATWFLPRRLVGAGAALVAAVEIVAAVALEDPQIVVSALVGAGALGLYYGLIWLVSPRAMAFGDVRLAAALGLAVGPLGYGALLLSVLLAAVLAVLAVIPLRRGGAMIRRRLPYGPFLVLGALGAVVVGQVVAAS